MTAPARWSMRLTVSAEGLLDVGFEAAAPGVTDGEVTRALVHVLAQSAADPGRAHPTTAELAEMARRGAVGREHPATHMVAVDGVARWLCAECAGPGAIALPPGSVAPCAEHLSRAGAAP